MWIHGRIHADGRQTPAMLFMKRCMIATGSAFAVLIVYVALVKFGARGELPTFDPDGMLTLVASVIAVAAALSIIRGWRPTIARVIVWTLVSFAWFSAAITDYSTEQNTQSSVIAGFSLLILGLAYVLWFQPAGRAEAQRVADEHLRTIIRQEFKNAFPNQGGSRTEETNE